MHAARLPGTNTAAFDFLGTIAIAWAMSALTGVRCSLWAIALLSAGEAAHAAFCVELPVRGR